MRVIKQYLKTGGVSMWVLNLCTQCGGYWAHTLNVVCPEKTSIYCIFLPNKDFNLTV